MPAIESVITPERFQQGRSFEQYLAYLGSPENLEREGSGGKRTDFSGFLREKYQQFRLTEEQTAALKWLTTRPNAPAKLLVIAEDWSSDCRRDIPMFARLAEAANLELRFFDRDGKQTSHMKPELSHAPGSNVDLMDLFPNVKDGQAYQSIPVGAFFTADHKYLYHYTEYPKVYEKDAILAQIRRPRPGESEEDASKRFSQQFWEMQQSPFFRVWACAAADEIISELHRRLAYG